MSLPFKFEFWPLFAGIGVAMAVMVSPSPLTWLLVAAGYIFAGPVLKSARTLFYYSVGNVVGVFAAILLIGIGVF